MDDLSEARGRAKDRAVDAATEELRSRIASLERELEHAKEDRNRAGVIERRKYLPELGSLRRRVAAADRLAMMVKTGQPELIRDALTAWQEASRG